MGAKKGSDPLIVFRLSGPLAPHTRIAEGGLAGATAAGLKQSPAARKKRLRKAGVKTGKAPVVARVGRHRAWFFYADRAPFKAYQHPGQVVLVDAKSGEVSTTRTLMWPPLIDGRLPAFMRTAAAYRNKKNYAFYRPYAAASSATEAVASAEPTLARTAATQQAADTLAAQHACAVRISDTLGDFYDFGNIDSTRARLGQLLEGLEQLNHGFISVRYSTYSNKTPTGFIQNLITSRGCKQVLVYIAGGGIKGAHSTAVIGQSAHADGTLDAQYLSSGQIAGLVGQNRGVEFDLLVDAPFADGFATESPTAAFAAALTNQPNVALVLTPSGGAGGGFTFLPELAVAGGLERNTGNPDGLLELTNRVLVGMDRVLANPAAVGQFAAQSTPGVLAWLLFGAFQSSADVNFPDQLGGAPQLTTTPELTLPPPAGGAVNTTPLATAQSQTTPEDTATPITLAGLDADGDPLTFAVASQPSHGTLSGTAPNLTYTPDPNFNGADSFTFTVSDGNATSAPATVAITVTPLNDPPTATSTAFSVEQDTSMPIDLAAAAALVSDVETADADLTVTIVTPPAHGDLSGSGASAAYTPHLGYTGPDSFSYKVTDRGDPDNCGAPSPSCDAPKSSTTETVSIIVTPVNQAPTANPDSVSLAEDGSTAIDLSTLVSDTETANANLSYAIIGGPAHGTLSPGGSGPAQTYTPDPDYNGPDAFTYSVTDRGNPDNCGTVSATCAATKTSTATVSITVDPVNDAPTDISLTSQSIAEDQPSGSTVGDLSATDPDTGDSHTFTLVSGAGSTDNSSFTISGNQLKTATALDFEIKPSYSIRIQADDGNGGTFEKVFTISVTNVNDAPTDIALTNSAIDENQPQGTAVGTLSSTDQDAGDSHSYSLVPGSGSDDNSQFQISGTTLESATSFDFETKSSYTVRIRSDDGHGGTFEKAFPISVNDLNDTPTDISLSNASVAENQPSGTAVGNLSATDQDVGDSHTFSLVSGTGSDDNGSFQISGSTLEAAQTFDFEAKDSYSVRVGVNDGNGGTFEKQFTITVTNANDAPTDVALSPSSVPENLPSGTTVGTFSTSDQDTLDSHSYSLVAGTGSGDNGSFTIVGDSLQTNGSFNFEAKNSYSIRVQSDDGHSGTVEKVFMIAVTDVNDAPSDIALSNTSFVEHSPTGTPVGQLSTTDEDTGDGHTYSLVTGSGDTDNASFQINGSTLEIAADLPQGSYSVRIKTDDGNGGTFEKAFSIDAVPPNAAPTDIQLSNSSFNENQPAATSVGTLTTADPDAADSHTYSLVSGSGATDNGDFQISGDQLQTAHPLDFEAGATRSVRIEANDGHGGVFDKVFTITVNNTNDAPTDVALSPSSVAENQPSGTTVGNLSATDQDAADTHTFTLVSGTGSADNGSFTISGTQLKTAQSFDFETKASYSIRVQADDGHGGTFQKVLTVTVTDANDAPTDIGLSNNSVAENQLPGVTVGTLADTDQDAGDSATYSLVAGTGSTDNGSFQITGTTLQTNASFDFETKASYSIRVQVKDSGNATFEKVFTINVTNTNDAPTNVSVSPSSVPENQPSGTTVGSFSTTDQDVGDSFSYALVGGTGSDDNGSFTISGNQLKTAQSFDFETKASYSIRVRTTDAGSASFEKQLTITITNANDAPTDIALDNSSIDENKPSGSNVGNFSTTDQDAGDTFTYSLVAGTGSTDNGQFQITGGTLKSNASFNFEVKSSYSIRVRTTDSGAAFTEKQFTIQINDVNDPPVDGNESTSAVGNTMLEYGSVAAPSSEPKKVVSGNLLSNATDEDQPAQTLTVSAFDSTSAQGGSVSVSPSGAFSYRPQAGDTGADSFNYTISDSHGGTDSSTVTINIGTRVWYVKNNVAGAGTGTSNDPFRTLAAADTAANATGDITYVFKGDGSTTNLTGGFSLQTNQKLIGESHDLVVGTDTLFAGTAANRPSLSGTVTLASGSTVQGVNVAASAGAAIAGTNTGGSTIDDVNLSGANGGVALTGAAAGTFAFTNLAVSTTGGTAFLVNSTGTPTINVGSGGTESVSATGGSGVDINSINGASSIAFDSVSDSGGPLGINLNAIGTSNASFGTGSISGSTADFKLAGGSGTVSYAGTLGDGTGNTADITGRTGGAITLSGNINDTNDTGGGITMSGNTAGSTTFSGSTKTLNTGTGNAFSSTGSGHTINLTGGGLDIDTTSGNGLSVTGGGTINVTTGTNPNTIDTTTGTALTVTSTAIGASGLTFRSIAANGAPNGVVLNTPGSSGGLSVTGTGTTAGSGGTIQGVTNRGVSAISTVALSLANMNFTNDGSTNGADPTVATSTCGDLITGSNTGCNAAIHMDGVTGSASLTNLAVSGGNQIGINGNNVNNLTLSNSTVQNAGDQTREDGVRFRDLKGTSSITNSTLQGNEDNQLRIANGTGATGTLNISGSTFQNSTNPNGEYGFQLDTIGSGSFTTTIGTSTFNNTRGGGLVATAQSSSTLNVTASGGTWHGNSGAISNFDSAIQVVAADSSNVKFNVHDISNPILGYGLNVIHFQTNSPGTENLQGQVVNTVIGDTSSATSASTSGAGIGFNEQSTSNSKIRFSGNTIRGVSTFGITMQMGNLTTAATTVDATVQNNTISVTPTATALQGIFVNSGTTSANPPTGRPEDAGTFCADISGNVASSVNADGLRVRQRFGTTVRLPGYGGGASDTAAVNSFLATKNPSLGDTISSSTQSPGSFAGGAAGCAAPTLP